MGSSTKISEPKRLPMVGWYDPRQLAQTGVEVAVSTIFGRHSDHRLVEAMAFGDEQQDDYYDYNYHYKDNGAEICEPDKTKPRDSIWIDYVGDVGDGWNSTYALAYYLAAESRAFKYNEGGKTFDTTETQRGDILIFGGDEVYPTASRVAYKERLVVPYETALRTTARPSPHVFAIPGNHDWYDSLVAFTRLFTARRWFAGWRTRQSRSYFALKLPHNWWLLGTDVQLGSDLDAPQLEYFQRLAKHMKEEEERTHKRASIILCHAEPHWIRTAQYGGIDPNYNESNLKILEKRLGKDVAVYIAGDLHHYRRHEAQDQSTQKITAGGGGAFLHPTHAGLSGLMNRSLDTIVERDLDAPDDGAPPRPDQTFHRRGIFPTPRESWMVTLRNVLFPGFIVTCVLKRLFPKKLVRLSCNKSWMLGIATGVLYVLLTLPLIFRIREVWFLSIAWTFGNVLGTLIETALGGPVTALLMLLTFIGFVFFTDTHKKLYRVVGGGLHGIAHIVAAYWVALIFVSLLGNKLSEAVWRRPVSLSGFEFFLDWRKLLALIAIFVGGFMIGTLVMGLYLIISLNFFGRHGNEAFSSLAVEDWKNFLRLQIDQNGNLTIYPVGIRRVPRDWKPREQTSGPELVPNDRRATEPRLIEPPIFMKKAATETGVQTVPHLTS